MTAKILIIVFWLMVTCLSIHWWQSVSFTKPFRDYEKGERAYSGWDIITFEFEQPFTLKEDQFYSIRVGPNVLYAGHRWDATSISIYAKKPDDSANYLFVEVLDEEGNIIATSKIVEVEPMMTSKEED